MITWAYCEDNKYIDFSDAFRELKRPSPRLITKADSEGKTEEELKKFFEQREKEWDEYHKNPWLDGKKAEGEALSKYRDECTKELVDFCVQNRIFISDSEHQNKDWGCPVFDNKYKLTFTLRSWAGIMAEVWSKITGKELDYLDFYCSGDVAISNYNYRKPIDIK